MDKPQLLVLTTDMVLSPQQTARITERVGEVLRGTGYVALLLDGRMSVANPKSLPQELQMRIDELLTGSSFELDDKRVNPRHVVLHKDGTYTMIEKS